MAQSFSARSRAIEPFHVMALLARANELQAAGHDVIHLEIGEPDFSTAAPIVAAGQAALAAGHTRYTAARGIPQLREALAGFYAQRYGVSLNPERPIDPQRILGDYAYAHPVFDEGAVRGGDRVIRPVMVAAIVLLAGRMLGLY